MRRPRRRDGDPEGGQAVVELGLVLPVIALLALLLVQVALVVRAQVLVTHAAREGARAAAVDDAPGAAAEAVRAGAPLPHERVAIEVRGRGDTGSRVTVEVRYRMSTDVPLVGLLVGDVSLTAATTMRVE